MNMGLGLSILLFKECETVELPIFSGWSLWKGSTLLKMKRKPDFRELPEEYKFP